MTPTEQVVQDQLYATIKKIILATPRCPDGERLPCASCLAQSIAKALNDPARSPMEAVAGDIPIFTAKDVQSLINASVNIDRQECSHEACTRTPASVLLIPV